MADIYTFIRILGWILFFMIVLLMFAGNRQAKKLCAEHGHKWEEEDGDFECARCGQRFN